MKREFPAIAFQAHPAIRGCAPPRRRFALQPLDPAGMPPVTSSRSFACGERIPSLPDRQTQNFWPKAQVAPHRNRCTADSGPSQGRPAARSGSLLRKDDVHARARQGHARIRRGPRHCGDRVDHDGARRPHPLGTADRQDQGGLRLDREGSGGERDDPPRQPGGARPRKAHLGERLHGAELPGHEPGQRGGQHRRRYADGPRCPRCVASGESRGACLQCRRCRQLSISGCL